MQDGEILIVKNVSHEGPGLFEPVLKEQALQARVIDLERGETIPNPADFRAMIVLGGPDSANDPNEKILLETDKVTQALSAGIPYLGICLGLQILVKAAGGKVVKNPVPETGFWDEEGRVYRVEMTEEGLQDTVFGKIGTAFEIFHIHGETVELTPAMALLGTGKLCKNQIVRVGANAYGMQGHMELTLPMLREWIQSSPELRGANGPQIVAHFYRVLKEYTLRGKTLIRNFLETTGGLA
ncbi:MAG: type 1 glutamine amidotransferase [Candidatus Omnitrophota bacterium]